MRVGKGARGSGMAIGLIATLLLVGATSGCARQSVAGTPVAVGEIDTTNVGGKPVTDGPTGPRKAVVDAKLDLQNGDGGEMDRLAVNAVSDIYDYWTDQLPTQFD